MTLRSALVPLLALALGATSCGAPAASPNGTWNGDAMFLGGPCQAFVAHPPEQGYDHVPVGTQVQYSTNPPTSGSHYPIWSEWGTWPVPIPPGYFVHNEEHGGVVLLYKCSGAAACARTASQLQAILDALPTDPLCTAQAPGVRTRTLLFPDPDLDVPVAAASWTWFYKAQCVDPTTLGAFVRAHYAQGREDICYQGDYIPASPHDAGAIDAPPGPG